MSTATSTRKAPEKEITPMWIRPAEWEARTGMSKAATYRALRSGELRGALVGRTWFIEFGELESYFERHRRSVAA